MPSAKKLQTFLRQGDLSSSDQQQLARSIADLKKKRAQKRSARVATLPFEIQIHSWYYINTTETLSEKDLEKRYQIPRTIPHTFVARPRFTRFQSSTINKNHRHKFHIDAVIRCPDFASIQNVCRIFRQHSLDLISYSPGVNQIFLHYPTHPKINPDWTAIARQQLGIDCSQPDCNQKIWRHFNPDETSRISVTFRDEIIFDNNDSNQLEIVGGFLSIVGRYMMSGAGFGVDAKGQFIP